MKLAIFLLAVAGFTVSNQALAGPKEDWDKNASPDEKEALTSALEALASQTSAMSKMKSDLSQVGSKALGLCGFTKARGSAVSNILKPDSGCYKAGKEAFATFDTRGHRIMRPFPELPRFLEAGKQPRPEKQSESKPSEAGKAKADDSKPASKPSETDKATGKAWTASKSEPSKPATVLKMGTKGKVATPPPVEKPKKK